MKITIEQLEKQISREVSEWNAGWECAQKGGSITDEPDNITEDQWAIGFQAGSYTRLVKELDICLAALQVIASPFGPCKELDGRARARQYEDIALKAIKKIQPQEGIADV